MIKEQAHRQRSRLIGFGLENVKGMLDCLADGIACPADEHRERIYIMGRKIDQFSRSVPLTDAETIQIVKKKLRDFLD
eukprot:6535831-Pyramimonas_sp.AAC.1